MLLDRTAPGDIATTLGIDDVHLKRRVRDMLARLRVPFGRPAPADRYSSR